MRQLFISGAFLTQLCVYGQNGLLGGVQDNLSESPLDDNTPPYLDEDFIDDVMTQRVAGAYDMNLGVQATPLVGINVKSRRPKTNVKPTDYYGGLGRRLRAARRLSEKNALARRLGAANESQTPVNVVPKKNQQQLGQFTNLPNMSQQNLADVLTDLLQKVQTSNNPVGSLAGLSLPGQERLAADLRHLGVIDTKQMENGHVSTPIGDFMIPFANVITQGLKYVVDMVENQQLPLNQHELDILKDQMTEMVTLSRKLTPTYDKGLMSLEEKNIEPNKVFLDGPPNAEQLQDTKSESLKPTIDDWLNKQLMAAGTTSDTLPWLPLDGIVSTLPGFLVDRMGKTGEWLGTIANYWRSGAESIDQVAGGVLKPVLEVLDNATGKDEVNEDYTGRNGLVENHNIADEDVTLERKVVTGGGIPDSRSGLGYADNRVDDMISRKPRENGNDQQPQRNDMTYERGELNNGSNERYNRRRFSKDGFDQSPERRFLGLEDEKEFQNWHSQGNNGRGLLLKQQNKQTEDGYFVVIRDTDASLRGSSSSSSDDLDMRVSGYNLNQKPLKISIENGAFEDRLSEPNEILGPIGRDRGKSKTIPTAYGREPFAPYVDETYIEEVPLDIIVKYDEPVAHGESYKSHGNRPTEIQHRGYLERLHMPEWGNGVLYGEEYGAWPSFDLYDDYGLPFDPWGVHEAMAAYVYPRMYKRYNEAILRPLNESPPKHLELNREDNGGSINFEQSGMSKSKTSSEQAEILDGFSPIVESEKIKDADNTQLAGNDIAGTPIKRDENDKHNIEGLKRGDSLLVGDDFDEEDELFEDDDDDDADDDDDDDDDGRKMKGGSAKKMLQGFEGSRNIATPEQFGRVERLINGLPTFLRSLSESNHGIAENIKQQAQEDAMVDDVLGQNELQDDSQDNYFWGENEEDYDFLQFKEVGDLLSRVVGKVLAEPEKQAPMANIQDQQINNIYESVRQSVLAQKKQLDDYLERMAVLYNQQPPVDETKEGIKLQEDVAHLENVLESLKAELNKEHEDGGSAEVQMNKENDRGMDPTEQPRAAEERDGIQHNVVKQASEDVNEASQIDNDPNKGLITVRDVIDTVVSSLQQASFNGPDPYRRGLEEYPYEDSSVLKESGTKLVDLLSDPLFSADMPRPKVSMDGALTSILDEVMQATVGETILDDDGELVLFQSVEDNKGPVIIGGMVKDEQRAWEDMQDEWANVRKTFVKKIAESANERAYDYNPFADILKSFVDGLTEEDDEKKLLQGESNNWISDAKTKMAETAAQMLRSISTKVINSQPIIKPDNLDIQRPEEVPVKRLHEVGRNPGGGGGGRRGEEEEYRDYGYDKKRYPKERIHDDDRFYNNDDRLYSNDDRPKRPSIPAPEQYSHYSDEHILPSTRQFWRIL